MQKIYLFLLYCSILMTLLVLRVYKYEGCYLFIQTPDIKRLYSLYDGQYTLAFG